MIAWLQLTDDQRRETLAQAQVRSGIPTKPLEKDWWVTLTLKALFQTPFAQYMVFKGGTSLSKGFNLIERFSEDIDIALDPAAFGIEYKQDPSRGYLSKLRKEGCAFTSTVLLDALKQALTDLGLPDDIVTIKARPVAEDQTDRDPQELYVYYPPLYAPNAYIPDNVKIEVSVRSVQMPHVDRPMGSLLYQYFPLPAYAETPFTIPVIEPKKTFLEKAFLLHEEFSRPPDKVRTFRLTRHSYDLYRNLSSSAMQEALSDHALYDHLVEHRERYNKISGIDYSLHHHATINFLPPVELYPALEKDFTDMRENMIYADTPPMVQMIQELKTLQARFRLKYESRPFEQIIEAARALAQRQEGETVEVNVVFPPEQASEAEAKYQVNFVRIDGDLVLEAVVIIAA